METEQRHSKPSGKDHQLYTHNHLGKYFPTFLIRYYSLFLSPRENPAEHERNLGSPRLLSTIHEHERDRSLCMNPCEKQQERGRGGDQTHQRQMSFSRLCNAIVITTLTYQVRL